MHPDSAARTKPLSMFVLAMMNTAIVVGLEGLPEVGSFGLPLVLYYLIFTLIYFMPVGLVAAELGAGWPGSGGVYQWVKEALGERVAFVAIWCQWVQILIWYPTVLAVCAVSVAYIFDPLLGSSAGFILAVSLAVFWFATLSNFRGLRASGFLTTLFLYAGTFVPVLLAIGLAGWWLASGREPAIDLSVGAIVPEIESVGDFVGILAIFSFLSGLEVNAVHFNKVRDPQRSIALSILISGVLVLSVSVLGALSVAVMVPVGGIDLAAGTLQVFDRVLGELGVGWLVPLIAFLALAGMLGHIMVWVIGPTESLRVAADDGLIPPVFQRVTSGGAPRNVMLMQAVVVSLISLLALVLDLNQVFYVLTIVSAQVYLVMYALMFISVIVLRYTHPQVDRAFRIPGGRAGLWGVAGVGFLACVVGIGLMFVPPNTLDIRIESRLFTPLMGLFFVGILLVPLLLHRFRNPDWARSRLPSGDEVRTAWKRGD